MSRMGGRYDDAHPYRERPDSGPRRRHPGADSAGGADVPRRHGGRPGGDRGADPRDREQEPLPLLRRRRRAGRGSLLRARVRGAHGLEARALRQRRLLGAHLCADRRGHRRGGRGDRAGVHVERDAERRARHARSARPCRGGRVADARPGRRRAADHAAHARDSARCTCAARPPPWTSSLRSRRNTTSS